MTFDLGKGTTWTAAANAAVASVFSILELSVTGALPGHAVPPPYTAEAAVGAAYAGRPDRELRATLERWVSE
jgi:hypothetical protein